MADNGGQNAGLPGAEALRAYQAQLQQQSAMLQGLMTAPPTDAPPSGPTPTWLDMLQNRSPRSQPDIGAIQQINPGVTWGGRDRNVMMPNDVQSARFYGHDYDPI